LNRILSLCDELAFVYDNDRERVDAAFRESSLYRQKWDDKHYADGRTHGEETLNKACKQANTFQKTRLFHKFQQRKSFKDFTQAPSGVISLGELLLKNPQSTPLIKGIINTGEGLVIHADGGLGKSMFELWLSIQIASGRLAPLFGKFMPMKRTASMFIQTENSGADFNTRIRKMVGSNPELIKALDYITLPLIHNDVLSKGMPFSNPDFQKWLIAKVDESEKYMGQPVDILWIDPLISFAAGDENDSSKRRHELDALSDVCRGCGVTPIVIHHDNRNGNYRGSSAIYDWCRGMIGLKEEFIASDRITDLEDASTGGATVSCIRVTHEKANNMKKFNPFLMRMDHNLNFQKIEESFSPEQKKQGLLIQQALTDLGKNAVIQNDLIKTYVNLSGLSQATARRHIKKATDNRFIFRSSTQKDGQQAYEYSLYN